MTKPAKYLGPLARSRPRTAKQHTAAERRLYREEARAFVATAILMGGTCIVVNTIPELRDGKRYGHRISNKLTEIHHCRGRAKSLLRDKRFWMPVSRAGHRWLHANIAEARAHGWICEAGQWNTPLK